MNQPKVYRGVGRPREERFPGTPQRPRQLILPRAVLRAALAYPRLSDEDVRLLASRRTAQDAEHLIMSNLLLVWYFVKGLARGSKLREHYHDLLQEGFTGLIDSCRRYRPEGARISTYAAWLIRQRMYSFLRRGGRVIAIPPGIDMEDHPDAILLPDETLDAIRERAYDFEPERDQVDLKRTVVKVLSTLSPRERMIVTKYFGLGGQEPQTLKAIGKETGVSGTAIMLIKARALRRLRHPSRIASLWAYYYDDTWEDYLRERRAAIQREKDEEAERKAQRERQAAQEAREALARAEEQAREKQRQQVEQSREAARAQARLERLMILDARIHHIVEIRLRDFRRKLEEAARRLRIKLGIIEG